MTQEQKFVVVTETAFKGSLRECTPDDFVNFYDGKLDKNGLPVSDDYLLVDEFFARVIPADSAWAIAVKKLFE
jgi:hypothetical protein